MASVTDSDSQDKKKESQDGGDSEGAPQIRLDTTEEEQLEMFQPYLKCLKDHKVPIHQAGSAGETGAGKFAGDPSQLWYPSVDVSKYPDAVKACTSLRPLQPPETDPKKNPNYMDDFREQVECMDKRGLKVDPLPDGSGWNYADGAADSMSTAEMTQIEQECEMEAFGGKN